MPSSALDMPDQLNGVPGVSCYLKVGHDIADVAGAAARSGPAGWRTPHRPVYVAG